jgi:hypothetical protein
VLVADEEIQESTDYEQPTTVIVFGRVALPTVPLLDERSVDGSQIVDTALTQESLEGGEEQLISAAGDSECPTLIKVSMEVLTERPGERNFGFAVESRNRARLCEVSNDALHPSPSMFALEFPERVVSQQSSANEEVCKQRDDVRLDPHG